MIRTNLLLFCLFSSLIKGYAQIDTVNITKQNLLTSYLTEGNNRYLAWNEDASTKIVSHLIYWQRDVTFNKRDGKDVVIVSQYRLAEDSVKNTTVYTVSDRKTFQTIYDYRYRKDPGIESYDYKGNQITASDTVKRNTKRAFILNFKDIPYCFELDLETLSLLPIKHVGQKLAIIFYHPGGIVPPQYYPIDVIREERLASVNGMKIDCWVIRLTYDTDHFDYSWISRDKHEFLKLESHSPKGTYNKIKLAI